MTEELPRLLSSFCPTQFDTRTKQNKKTKKKKEKNSIPQSRIPIYFSRFPETMEADDRSFVLALGHGKTAKVEDSAVLNMRHNIRTITARMGSTCALLWFDGLVSFSSVVTSVFV